MPGTQRWRSSLGTLMGRKLLIVGASGHGKVVADAALSSGIWTDIAFLDDRFGQMAPPLGFPLVGRTDDLGTLHGEYAELVVAIGNAAARMKVIALARSVGFLLPSIVHRTAVISPFATLGDGCVVFAQAVINPDATLGQGCIVNTGATIDHDCRIGDGVHVCPGTHLAGDVHVGNCSWIGIGASVKQGVSIGNGVTVGAGAVVVTNVPDSLTVVGVPARPRS